MSKRPKPEKFEKHVLNDAVAANRGRSPSTANFDGTATWSPSNFRKTLDLTKMLGKPSGDNSKLEKLIEESSGSPLSFAPIVGSKDFADAVFHVGNHALYIHKCILETRCPALFTVGVKDRGKKGQLTTLKSDDKLVDLRSLALVVEYLYTGSVPFGAVSPAEVISLIAHANMFQLDRLRWLCERYLQAVLDHDLFFTLLLVSDISGVASAKQLCLVYGSLHFEELITRKEQVHTLGIELFREFVVFSTLNTEITPDLSQQSYPNTIKEEFKIIFTAMANPDAFFFFKASNTTTPCHKVILFAQSERFKTLFLEEGGPSTDGRYTLPKNVTMSHEAFRSFLAWAYYRDTSFNAAHAAMILPLAHSYNIPALIDECQQKLRTGISAESVLPILTLCFSEWSGKDNSYKNEFEKPCLAFLMLNFARVDLSGIKNPAICAAIAESARNAVISGLWSPISSEPNHEEPSVPSEQEGASPEEKETPPEEQKPAESAAEPEAAPAPEATPAPEEAPETPSEDKKSSRRKKRRTMAVDATEVAAAVAEAEAEEAPASSPKTSKTSTPKTSRSKKSKTGSSANLAAPAPAQEETPAEPAPVAAVEETPAPEEPVKPAEELPKEEAKKEEEAKPEPEPEPEKVAEPEPEPEPKKAAEPEPEPEPKKIDEIPVKVVNTPEPADEPAKPSPKQDGKKKEDDTTKASSDKTREKRSTFTTSSSVKAIKESIEAKEREEKSEKEAEEKIRASRREKQSRKDKAK